MRYAIVFEKAGNNYSAYQLYTVHNLKK